MTKHYNINKYYLGNIKLLENLFFPLSKRGGIIIIIRRVKLYYIICRRFFDKTLSRRLSFNICLYILYLLIKYYLIYLRTHNIIYAASFDSYFTLSPS